MKEVNHVIIIDTLYCGTRFGSSEVTILAVQNKNFSGDPEEPNEVPGADEEVKSHVH